MHHNKFLVALQHTHGGPTHAIKGPCAHTRGPLQKYWWTCLKITTS